MTFFTGLDAVRGFAGHEYEQAVVEEAARRALCLVQLFRVVGQMGRKITAWGLRGR